MNNLNNENKLNIGGMKLSVKIHKGEKFYIAEIPELGVITQGRTREEAKKNLKEAVELQVSVNMYKINYQEKDSLCIVFIKSEFSDIGLIFLMKSSVNLRAFIVCFGVGLNPS